MTDTEWENVAEVKMECKKVNALVTAEEKWKTNELVTMEM